MNRTLKKISPLFFILSLAGCGLFEDRYDPLEAGEHLYLMDSFYFTESDNSQLYWSTWGTVDREDLTVDVDVPPSLDMTTESLTANITIENAGLGEDSYWYTTTDPIVWNYTYDYKVSRHDFDTDWTGEAIYEVTFRIKFNPALLSSLSVYNDSTTNWSSSGTYYSSTADFELALSFNDDVDPTDLGSAAFIAGLTGSNGNLSSLTETSFS
ncbi:MAG: hypothetical protein PQJ60_14645, partial [Spirochaetales bacterium]|nr:hypothetical protein [Spirochaetales bacterium]